MPALALGIDLGGTKIAAGVVDAAGRILGRGHRPTRPREGWEAVVGRMIEAGEEALAEASAGVDDLLGVGVGSPGPVNPQTGVVVEAANLYFKDVPVVRALYRHYRRPTYLEHDARAAALGEYRYGAGRGAANLVFVTVSTGIGAGIVLDGRLVQGSHFSAGELGHTVVVPEGPLCTCGQRGCLEAVASGTGIANLAREAMERGEAPVLRELAGGDPEGVDARLVAEAVRRGDPGCREVLDQATFHLGMALAGVVNLIDCDRIVIGGGVAKMGELLFEPVRRTVTACVVATARNVQIIPAALGPDAGILGAAALAFTPPQLTPGS
ncbi:glucokinase [Limnochorda pilosa]|uniref:Glucokinase n=1 Tax=Limnochorda pilosa TaxID=1555112 RepID=A0A0K2SNN3_LIMPI|nr:glucokinase [Limnochorda pilosa]